VRKKLIKNSQPFGKNFQKTAGGIFLTHTVESFGYIFVPDSIDLSSFKFSRWASKVARVVLETECIMALQVHPRSIIWH